MQIRFYTDFIKRNNSTKLPDDTKEKYIQYEGWFKSATSVNTPIMQIDIGENSSPLNFKYCQIVNLGIYYFVQDIVSRTNTIWDFYLVEDCLATLRGHVIHSAQYVLRSYIHKSEHTYVNDQIPLSTDYTYYDTKIDGFIDTSTVSEGAFCLGIQKDSAESGAFVAGSVSYYVLTPSSLQAFINALISVDLSGTTGLSKMATFSAVNPIQYIVSCVWIPFTVNKVISQTGTGLEEIGVLDWKSGVSGYRVKNTAIFSDRGRVLVSSIPKHPQRGTYGNWVDVQGSQYSLTLRGYGQIALDPIITGACDTIIGDQYIDVTSGASVLKIYGRWEITQYTQFQSQMNAQIGVSIQLSQIQKDVFATATIAGTSVPIGMIDAVGGTQALTGAISTIAKTGDQIITSSNPLETATSMAGSAIGKATEGTLIGNIGQGIKDFYETPMNKVRAYQNQQRGSLHSKGGHFSGGGSTTTESKDRATPLSDFASKLNSVLTSYMHNFGVTSGSVGSTGTFASLGGIDELYSYFQLYGGDNKELVGTPEGRWSNNLTEYFRSDGQPAFIQCLNPTFNRGNTYEKAKIIDYLSGGMYLE